MTKTIDTTDDPAYCARVAKSEADAVKRRLERRGIKLALDELKAKLRELGEERIEAETLLRRNKSHLHEVQINVTAAENLVRDGEHNVKRIKQKIADLAAKIDIAQRYFYEIDDDDEEEA